MGFGKKRVGWVKWCISIETYSVLVNGTSTGFFNNLKGLRQGDLLLPYIFVIGMEALSYLIKKAVSGGYLTGYRVKGRGDRGVQLTHLLYVDDTLVFYETSEEQLAHLSWVLMWFATISDLKINLDKSEILLVGRVENLEELALEFG